VAEDRPNSVEERSGYCRDSRVVSAHVLRHYRNDISRIRSAHRSRSVT